MATNQNKTTETTASVEDFLSRIADESKRNDSRELIKQFSEYTGMEPRMWGPSIIGFGSYHYKYESGREGDSPLLAFSPRSAAISLYLSSSFEQREELLARFGKHKAEKGCIYVKKLSDIHLPVLRQMVKNHLEYMKETYPGS